MNYVMCIAAQVYKNAFLNTYKYMLNIGWTWAFKIFIQYKTLLSFHQVYLLLCLSARNKYRRNLYACILWIYYYIYFLKT